METPGEILPRQTAPGADVMSPPYGLPSIYEADVVRRERTGGAPYPTRKAAVSLTPLQDLHGVITPNGLHYERHHSGVADDRSERSSADRSTARSRSR